VLFFVDESFQTVGGRKVGALGAVAFPDNRYNHFCGWVFKTKRDVLGATELLDCEMKGNDCFAKAAFTHQAQASSPSALLTSVDSVLAGLRSDGAVVFAVWTDQPELLTLRKAASTQLTKPYVDLLGTFAHFVQIQKTKERGSIFLDQLGHREDKHAACVLQNYIARSDQRIFLQRNLIQVPHYTHSAVSPGLQVADLVAYLAAQQAAPQHRPELGVWWAKFAALGRYEHGAPDTRGRRRERVTVGPLLPATRQRRDRRAEHPKRR
jgi:hypothetical protein